MLANEIRGQELFERRRKNKTQFQKPRTPTFCACGELAFPHTCSLFLPTARRAFAQGEREITFRPVLSCPTIRGIISVSWSIPSQQPVSAWGYLIASSSSSDG